MAAIGQRFVSGPINPTPSSFDRRRLEAELIRRTAFGRGLIKAIFDRGAQDGETATARLQFRSELFETATRLTLSPERAPPHWALQFWKTDPSADTEEPKSAAAPPPLPARDAQSMKEPSGELLKKIRFARQTEGVRAEHTLRKNDLARFYALGKK